MRAQGKNRKGSSLLEFTLVAIPLIFVVISLFELTRGMWTYQGLSYAVREGVRYASVHGRGCASPNTCQVTVGQITRVIRSAGPGFDTRAITLTFTPASGTAISGTMATLLTNNTVWPPAGANAPGLSVKISMKYSFKTVLAVVWPGSGHVFNRSQTFTLPASSTEAIQF